MGICLPGGEHYGILRRGDHGPPLCSPVDPNLDKVGWYCGNAGTHPVKGKQPNAWGLYDMHGNVFEWCWDWWSGNDYGSKSAIDPTGAPSGSYRVFRGGRWISVALNCRSANRLHGNPGYDYDKFGFRVARTAL